MTLWFGESWGAPICAPDEHILTPVGEPCMYCDEPIEKDDQGVRMPYSRGEEVGLVAGHLYCFMLKVLPHGPDCERCRGLERDQHKLECGYRKNGECDCEFGKVAQRMVSSEMTVGEAAKELGMLEADLLDRLDLWSHRRRALKDCRRTGSAKGQARGFTVIELLIVVFIVGILASLVGYTVIGALGWGESSSEIFDERPSARKWAEELSYTFIAANCSNAPEGLRVSCTVRVEERPEPIGLQCHVVSKKCGLMPVGR